MTVRAKFKCMSITEQEGGLKSASLQPVVSGSPENEKFFKWTPGGQIQLSTINPDAAAQFVPGRQFYVDFTAEGEPTLEPYKPVEYVIVQRTGGDVDAKAFYAHTWAEACELKTKVEAENGSTFHIFSRAAGT